MAHKIKITIQGMHCASCATNVERAVKKIKGVKEANVSLLTNKAFVEAEENLEGEIKKAIEKMGYKVLGVEKQ